MELRMVARRSRDSSMTVLGDLAQATSPAAQIHWEDAVEHLMAPKARVEELEVGYRVPAPILEYANQLLPEAAPHVQPSRSVRLKGEPPEVVSTGRRALTATVAREVVGLTARWTSVGVIGPRSILDEIGAGLTAAGVPPVDARQGAALGEHLTLLPPATAKGLEFDAVVVVEPGSIVSEEPSGVRILYVALTRAVQRLTIVHADPLPAALG
jgi:DNA helicase IV